MNEKRAAIACSPMEAALLLVSVLLRSDLTEEQRDKICEWWNDDVKRHREMKDGR